METDLLVQIGGYLVASGAVYGGIRNDLINMRRDVDRAERGLSAMRKKLKKMSRARRIDRARRMSAARMGGLQ